MNLASCFCTPVDLAYCGKERQAKHYEVSKSEFPAETLINSPRMEYIDCTSRPFFR